MVMDKYNKRKSTKLSDSQLISREISQRLNSTPKRERNWDRREEDREVGNGSFSSLENSNVESEPFGAMLRIYARKTEPQPERREAEDGTTSKEKVRAWSPREKGEGSDGDDSVNSENYSVALSLNYEVRRVWFTSLVVGYFSPHRSFPRMDH